VHPEDASACCGVNYIIRGQGRSGDGTTHRGGARYYYQAMLGPHLGLELSSLSILDRNRLRPVSAQQVQTNETRASLDQAPWDFKFLLAGPGKGKGRGPCEDETSE
jgi:hypothetical protein